MFTGRSELLFERRVGKTIPRYRASPDCGEADSGGVTYSDPFGLCPTCDWRADNAANLLRDTRETTIRNLARQSGSELGARFVEHFFGGSGQKYNLSQGEFSEVAGTLAGAGADSAPGTRVVSFYGTELAGAFGRATATFGEAGLASISDRYDFNAQPIGTRPLSAELKTRAVAFVGWLFGAKAFDIDGEAK